MNLERHCVTGTTAAEEAIRIEIAKRGKIDFAQFMDLALYHPTDGYYTSAGPFGAAGDYFTSPSAHPSFGALLAAQLYRMWQLLEEPNPFFVLEVGVGNGQLARDIKNCIDQMTKPFSSSLKYVGVERYSASSRHTGFEQLITDGMPIRGIDGCIISNELIDSFPVHRFQMENGDIKEIYVTTRSDGRFSEKLHKPSTRMIARRLDELPSSLEDGFRGEVNLKIDPWLEEASKVIRRGFILTIDYGYDTAQLYSEKRSTGTLQTHYRHTRSSNPFQRVGRQDLTAHVDFGHIMRFGRSIGLLPVAFLVQAQYLAAIGFNSMLSKLRSMPISEHDKNANQMAMRELVKIDGLGNFKVLIQEKGLGIGDASQLLPESELMNSLSVPLISSDHTPLMEGKYYHMIRYPY